MKCEIVVFSPARRASRKLLERMVEFIRLLGHEPVEYNQEQCRVNTYDGRQALIRSFPSVCQYTNPSQPPYQLLQNHCAKTDTRFCVFLLDRQSRGESWLSVSNSCPLHTPHYTVHTHTHGE